MWPCPTFVHVLSICCPCFLIVQSCTVAAMALHGEMLQERRSAILADFQSGKYALLVATGGLVGRGLDLPHCRQVDVCVCKWWAEAGPPSLPVSRCGCVGSAPGRPIL